MRAGISGQSFQRLSKSDDILFAKTRLPALFDDAESPVVSVLGNSAFRGEARYLYPCAARLRPDHGDAFLLEDAHRHADRLLRDARQERKVPDAHSFFIEDPHDVGADRERQLRFALELDGERQQHPREERRQERDRARRPGAALRIRDFAEQPIPRIGRQSGSSTSIWPTSARSDSRSWSIASSPKRSCHRFSMTPNSGRHIS